MINERNISFFYALKEVYPYVRSSVVPTVWIPFDCYEYNLL